MQDERTAEKSKKTFRRRAPLRDRAVLAFAIVSIVSIFIVVPRPTRPHLVPLPRFDLKSAQRLDEAERERARAVIDGSLPNSVRSIGEQLRRVGADLAAGEPISSKRLARLSHDARSLLAEERSDELRNLRALQSELFVEAVRRHERTGKTSRDLEELGGNFVVFLKRGWTQPGVGVVFDDPELRLLFRHHFNALTGLSHLRPFAPDREELRWYYATLFEHPAVGPGEVDARHEAQIRYAAALGKADPDYDSRLVQGLLHLRLRRPAQAGRMLSEYLKSSSDGQWRRVAENALAHSELLSKQMLQSLP